MIVRKLMQEVIQPVAQEQAPERLTTRELEILNLLARGMNNSDIAARLHVQEVTVRSHVSRIFDKLHVANRVQATLFALREGLATLDDPP
jgi:NarL family two-component system response regulator LiaR